MKQLSLFIILFISGIILKAQAPEKINYQAVARDVSGNPLVNQTLNVTYEIRQSSPTGTSVYTETHTGISTNQFGLFTAEIGGGTPSAGTFAGINWGAGLHYLYVEVNGDPMGSSQLLSVPYALYSKQSANGPQGVPGKNSISIVTPEPTGANCQNGGNKIDIGTDDNGDNILQPLEIDFTYYVCNGDSGATGMGVNWLGNGVNFPPAPNNENDAFYHSTHNTSYIYNGTAWDTLVSGNVGSAGFWSQSGNTIYNNNNSNLGNVSIGSTLSLSKLTVAATDSTVASFIGNNANVAAISVINANATGASGVAFVNGSNSNAFVGYSPSNKTLSIVNNVTDGHIFINSDSAIVNNSLVIANQAQKIANQAQIAIYNNTDTIHNYSPSGPILHTNSGLFLTDSLYVLGNNFLNTNWILANDGSGQAKWTDPNTLGLGNDNWGTQVIVSNATLNGDGTAGNPLSVNGVLTDNQDLSLTGNTLSLTNDPTPVDLTPYLDNTDAQTLSLNTNVLSISNGNNVTLPTSPWAKTSSTIHPAIAGDYVGIGTTNASSPLTINSVIGSDIQFIGTSNADISASNQLNIQSVNNTFINANEIRLRTANTDRLVVANGGNVGIGTNTPNQLLDIIGGENSSIDLTTGGLTLKSSVNSIAGAQIGTVSAHTLNLFTSNQNRMTILSGGNIGIGTTSPLAKLHIEDNASTVMMLKEVTPTSGAAFVMESMSQFVLISNESGTFRIEDNTNSNQPFNINPTGQVGIGGDAFYSALDVYGRITMRNGATTGYVPVSDANGTMTWTDPNTLLTVTPSPWTLNGTNIYPTTITNNVGIGTTIPTAKLEIQGATDIEAQVRSVRTSGATAIFGGGQLGGTLGTITNHPFYFKTNSLDRMTIDANGNVGIGTTTPGLISGASKYLSIMNTGPYIVGSITSLELGGNTSGGNAPASYIDFINNTSTPSNIARITARTSGTSTLEGQLAFSTNDGTLSERMRITQTGNVGIGTTTPGTSLEVNGAVTYTPVTAAAGSNASYALTVGDRSYIRVTTTFGGATLGSISNGLKAGQLLIIENVGGYLFTINDGGANLNIAGNALLYSNDTITLIWTGNRWLEISRSDN